MYENITLHELLDSFDNITLLEILDSFGEIKKFDLTKKFKICIISSESSNILNADIKEYYLSDVPLYLLYKKVLKVYHDENVIIVF